MGRGAPIPNHQLLIFEVDGYRQLLPLFPLKFSYYFDRESEAVGLAAAHLGELANLLFARGLFWSHG